jgi:hypothetical protein
MSSSPHDTTVRAADRAREVPEGWRRPSHGRGLLRPFPAGNSGRPKNVSTRFLETQQLARQHSLEAVQTLVERLRDPDGRIAVVAANSLLERAWGKVREAKPEEHRQAHVDLSVLTDVELALLVRLADSGRLVSVEDAPSAEVRQREGQVTST